MIQSLRAESINRALGFSSMRDFVQIACCRAHSTDWETQTWHALYRMEYAPFGGRINITSVVWTSNESRYFKREDGRPAVTLVQGMGCNLWLHSQLCHPLLSPQPLLEYTLTAWWSTCQGQPDVFWMYSSASLITEGQRSAPGGVLIRKTFPLSFALCLAIPFLTNVFSLLGWLAAMDVLHLRLTMRVKYANNPVCDFPKHYGGVMV